MIAATRYAEVYLYVVCMYDILIIFVVVVKLQIYTCGFTLSAYQPFTSVVDKSYVWKGIEGIG